MTQELVKFNANQAIQLPDVLQSTIPQVNELLDLFNLPREVLASDEEIFYAWRELPREIKKIPPELRNELIVKVCIASSVGLFDGAINYIWNATIISLRSRLKNFGIGSVAQALNKTLSDESDIDELMDSELLDICYKLELLSEEGYFLLGHCRDMRNNFSTAHPSIGNIDDRELLVFISRCCKYGLNSDCNLTGINLNDFLSSVKSNKLDDYQINEWISRLENTFPAQRQMLYPILLGIYCDSSVGETSRLNALKISTGAVSFLDDKTKSNLIDQHNKYFVKNELEKIKASRTFFQKLGLLELLSAQEQHSIIKNACDDLLSVHFEFNNFYNEPPFAKRLLELSKSIKIPNTVKHDYVTAVITCFTGNAYGASEAALPYYELMIRNFSTKEIDFLLGITFDKSTVASMIKSYPRCKKNYMKAINMIDVESLTPLQKTKLDKVKFTFGKNN